MYIQRLKHWLPQNKTAPSQPAVLGSPAGILRSKLLQGIPASGNKEARYKACRYLVEKDFCFLFIDWKRKAPQADAALWRKGKTSRIHGPAARGGLRTLLGLVGKGVCPRSVFVPAGTFVPRSPCQRQTEHGIMYGYNRTRPG